MGCSPRRTSSRRLLPSQDSDRGGIGLRIDQFIITVKLHGSAAVEILANPSSIDGPGTPPSLIWAQRPPEDISAERCKTCSAPSDVSSHR